MPGCIVSATMASFRSVEKRRRRATPVMTSSFENVSDIGVCLGLYLGPPAKAGVRSKRGAVQKACHSDRLEFVIIDNGSEDSDTLSYLDQLQRSSVALVIRDDRPFNWALFNNTAVAHSEAELFLFCNNDIEMLSRNWDQRIEVAAEPNIGAIGAKLLYPDGTVQHAGILLGPNGRSE